MQAVIMTGGLGTRLRPLTRNIPKGLVEVGGRPFLEHLILYLSRYGIDDILLCTGYLGDQIKSYFEDGSSFGVRINYSQEDHPLGTGGALRPALSKIQDIFFLINGDTFLPIEYNRMLDSFEDSSALMMLAVFKAEKGDSRANLRVEGREEITGLQGEGLSYIDAGVRLVRKEIMSCFPPDEVFSLEDDLYPRLIETGKIIAWPVEELYFDIGTPERIKVFEEYLRT
jgi:mannose-1-phosphate guanylyltransferase